MQAAQRERERERVRVKNTIVREKKRKRTKEKKLLADFTHALALYVPSCFSVC